MPPRREIVPAVRPRSFSIPGALELQVPFRPSKHPAIVQALTDDGDWLIDEAETRACAVRLEGQDSPSKPPSSTNRPQTASTSLDVTSEGGAWRIVMTVLRPREGQRYALVYTPEERLPALSGRVFRRLRHIHRCRDLLNGDAVTHYVNARIEEAIRNCLQIKRNEPPGRLGGSPVAPGPPLPAGLLWKLPRLCAVCQLSLRAGRGRARLQMLRPYDVLPTHRHGGQAVARLTALALAREQRALAETKEPITISAKPASKKVNAIPIKALKEMVQLNEPDGI